MRKMFNFHRFEESPLADFSIFNKFSKRPFLRLVLTSIICIVVGGVAGLILNYQTVKELRSAESEATLPVVEEEEGSQEKIATYSGTIKPSVYSKGAHYLEDDDGEVIVLLESPKIDLALIEGWEVEVEGTVENTEEGQLLMKVAEVRL